MLSFEMQVMNVDAIGLVDRAGSFRLGTTLAEYLQTLPGYWPPLYPVLCLLMDIPLEDIEFSGKLISILSGTGLIFIIYLLSRDLYGDTAALTASFLAAFFPVLIYYSAFTTPEMTYLFFLYASLLLFVKWVVSPGPFYAILTGLTASAAYLTRSEGILLFFQIIFMGMLVAFYKWRSDKHVFRPYARGLAFFIVAFILLASPFLLFLKQDVGSWSISRGGGMAFTLTKENIEPAVWSLTDDKTRVKGYFYESYRKQSLLEILKNDPEQITGKWSSNFKLLITATLPEMFINKYILAFFLALVLAALLLRRDIMHRHLLLLFMLAPIFITPLYVIELRTQIYIIPVVLILAAVSIGIFADTVINRAAGRLSFRPGPVIALITVAIISVTTTYYKILQPEFDKKGRYGLEQKKAGIWLRESGLSQGKVMARKPWTAFYSGNEILPLPLADYEDILFYARHNNARYLIIDDLLTTRMRPDLEFLLQEDPEELNLIYEAEGKVRLFAFKKQGGVK
ncbi:MAG: glycosyltransferase family 39 protein [Desulfobulbaceae bacterium]|nr:glycosyltransferase family 39 protein [Desulfobulbaceae bacterium]